VNIIVVYKKAWRIIFELYGHINYFQIAQIYKLFLSISYVFLMSYVHCEQALRRSIRNITKNWGLLFKKIGDDVIAQKWMTS
jgi:hypothetical protein